ncbi:MAG: hypothetical protein KF678_08045 [Phycisphaeraceae bacterium]|nr:hypothetical protein [Phycisphaeraceae bacterium]
MTARRVPGGTVFEQAIRVAGAMAELGVSDLVFKRAGTCTGLTARQTDLPGMLATMPPGSRLECASLGVVVEMRSSSLVWSAVAGGSEGKFAAAVGG